MMKKAFVLPLLVYFALYAPGVMAQKELSAKEIIAKAEDKMNGETNQAEITMTIVRPTWTREMTMKSWGKGDDLGLILVTAPARDKGMAFLKREKEIWNWQPTIDRTIKLPPSMMMQSWLGSDFTNDDLIKQSSIEEDYEHRILRSEQIENRDCYVIEMIPREEAAVVWGKVITWIDKAEFMQMKVEFYDEDNYLINTMYGKKVREMGGKLLPTLLEVVPADKEGHKTVVEYLSLEFDKPIDDAFFSVQNMKRVR